MNKRILFLILMGILCGLKMFARDEPGNNLGKSLYQMKQEFPELRCVVPPIAYQIGNDNDMYTKHFQFENNSVTFEMEYCRSKDSYSKDWYNEKRKTLLENYNPIYKFICFDCIVFCYSNFTITLNCIKRDDWEGAYIMYELGGLNKYLTFESFVRECKKIYM